VFEWVNDVLILVIVIYLISITHTM